MVLSVVTAAVFGAVSLYMMVAAKYTATRYMAWVSLSMAAIEVAMCGLLVPGEYPVLTVVLMGCRATVLMCCSLAMKRDAAMQRNRQRRRCILRQVTRDMMAEVQAMPTPCVGKRCA